MIKAVVSSVQLISCINQGRQMLVPSQVYQENLQISILV